MARIRVSLRTVDKLTHKCLKLGAPLVYNISKDKKQMPECVFLCGIPTSGKSTFVKSLFSQFYWENAIVLSTDNYIEKIAQEHNTTYNKIFEDCISVATQQLKLDFKTAVDDGRNIIWDQTNLSVKTRRKKLSKLPSIYKRGAVYFEISLEDALERNKHREGKFIPESILKRMYHQFEKPTVGEGFYYVEHA